MILFLGLSGSGKTTIVKLLSLHQKQQKIKPSHLNKYEFDELPVVIPTVGTNITNISYGRKSIAIREVGGCMAPIWKSYFADANAIVFVIDASNPYQISSASIELKKIVKSSNTQQLPILVLLNKTDIPTKISINELKYLFQLSSIIENSNQEFTLMELSCKNISNLNDIMKWFLTKKLFS